MTTDEIMALVGAYAQETKDFGQLDNSTARAALLTATEGLVRDAERYRWLKANIRDGYSFGRGYYLSDESDGWDRTVDAAIAAQKEVE